MDNTTPILLSSFTAGAVHIDVRAARLLRRLLDDGPGLGADRRGGAADPLAQRSYTRPCRHPRRQQNRPGAQSTRVYRR